MYLTQPLHRALQQYPDRTATVFRGRRLSYRALADRVARLAGALVRLGMAPGDRVAMLAPNSQRYVEYIMGVWWGGGVLNPINVRWSVPEIVYSLDDCDTRILLVDDAFLAHVDGIRAKARHSPTVIYAGEGTAPHGVLSFETLIAESPPVEDAWRGGDDLASIMYTGGTTGFPKGVMQTHMNLWSGCVPRLAELPPLPNCVVMHVAPLFHVAGLGRLVTQFLAGGTHVLMPSADAGELLATIEREAVTESVLVPTMIQALLAHPDLLRYNLGSLRQLYYGASPSAGTMVEQLIEKFPGIELSHSYGLTETCPVVSSNPPENHSEAARRSGLSRSVGRGGIGVAIRIVDADGREVPRGTVGEIVVRGPNITQGYWNKPEETARAMRNGWFHTGDGGYMDEQGYVFIVDRIKDMIVTGGENVYSAEIENVIARHPAVSMCAVIAVPHERWGEAVHAVVVLEPGASLDEKTLHEHCREHVAGYKCPKTVEFREALPLSAAGKILKRDLRDPYWSAAVRAG
jgi:long-chain acyl-CoA synthetase